MKEKNHSKKRRINILPKSAGSLALMILSIMVQMIFLMLLMMLDILPGKYALALVGLLVCVDVGLMLLMSGRKKTNRRLIGMILSTAVLCMMTTGCFYMYNTLDMLQKISKEEKSDFEAYHVIVPSDSNYETVDQVTEKTVYVLNTESKMHREATERLLTKVSVAYATEENAADVSRHVTEPESEANSGIVFLSNANYEMICQEDETFQERSRIIYSISVAIKSDDFAKHINVTEDPFNIFISGNDTYGSIEYLSRSDMNMIVTVNPQTREILLTSIQRDSYVPLHSFGAMDKLTHSGIYGVDETVMTVEDWLGIDLNYYIRSNFSMLVGLVDAMGGITVDSNFDFSSSVSAYSYVKGENQLTGEAALYFARERKAFEDEDGERIRNQQLVFKAILDKMTHSEALLMRYTDILGAVEASMETNMPREDITALVRMQLADMRGWNIKTISIEGNGGYGTTYSMGSNRELYVSIPREEMVEAAKKEIHAVMYPAEEVKVEKEGKEGE